MEAIITALDNLALQGGTRGGGGGGGGAVSWRHPRTCERAGGGSPYRHTGGGGVLMRDGVDETALKACLEMGFAEEQVSKVLGVGPLFSESTR